MPRPDGLTAGANFGYPVATSEGVVVSSSRWRDAERHYNRVHVYERENGAWTETARIEDPATEPPHLDRPSSFGSGLAISGDRLAVGSPGQDVDGEQDEGLVRVYRREGADWTLEATLTNHTGERARGIGSLLAMDGDLLAVGVPGRITPGTNSPGAIWVYRRTGTTWTFEAELVAPVAPDDEGSLDRAIDIDGDRVAVGIWAARDYRGSAYVWARQPDGTWELEAEVGPEGYGSGTGFGESVGISGDRLMVGAAAMKGSRGGVFEFRREGSEWVQVK